MKRLIGACLILTLVAVGGCSRIAHLTYLFVGDEHTETIEPEFEDLAHSTVAVVIYADEKIQYEYPEATLSLSTVISSHLRGNVELVQTVDPVKVRTYQHQNLGWESTDKAALGDRLGADYVLFVALREYGTREPGSLSLYRGHINAQAALYSAHEPNGAPPAWEADYLEVAYPEEAPTGVVGDVEDTIRYETDKAFADLLVKHFYEHEVPKYQ